MRTDPSDPTPRAFDTILLGGLTAGALDILDAWIVSALRGVRPARVLQAIASGLLGPAAFHGGAATAALGLALHFLIATGAATTYLAASRKLRMLTRHPIACGILFGLAVWAFMYHVVLPLSMVRPGGPPTAAMLANQLGIHAFGVGVPIALFASRSARRSS